MKTRLAIFAALLVLPFASHGCGICIEDKVAAAYDHAVVSRALGAKHQVAFFHIEGPLTLAAGARRSLAALAESTIGVDKGSVRVSLESRSLSVAFDPRRVPFATLQGLLEKKLAGRNLSLMPLKLMERPAELKAAPPP